MKTGVAVKDISDSIPNILTNDKGGEAKKQIDGVNKAKSKFKEVVDKAIE